MRTRITLAIVAVTAVAVVVFGLPLAIAMQRLYLNEARTRLERQATLMARDIPADFADGTDPLDLPNDDADAIAALYSPTGQRLSGTGPTTGDRAVRAAAANTITSYELGERLVAAVPVAVNEQIVAIVRLETSTHPAEHRAHLAWVLMAVFAVLVVGFAAGLATVQARRLTRPLRDVRDAASRLGHGNFDVGVEPSGIAELDDLANALRSTALRLERTLRRERDLTDHASHQLRTPIAGLRLAVETELTVPRSDPTLALNECLAIADRLDATVTDLVRLAREPARDAPLHLDELLNHVHAQWHGRLAAEGRRLVLPTELPTGQVHASGAAINQALDVLIDNARRHGRGTVTVAFDSVERGLALSVTDEGPGPTSADRHERGRRDSGHGIGLDLASALIEAEGGRLQWPGNTHPATFTIVLAQRGPTGPALDR